MLYECSIQYPIMHIWYLAKQTLRIMLFMCILKHSHIMKCSLCKIYRQMFNFANMFNFTYSIFRIDDNIVNFNNLGKKQSI